MNRGLVRDILKTIRAMTRHVVSNIPTTARNIPNEIPTLIPKGLDGILITVILGSGVVGGEDGGIVMVEVGVTTVATGVD